jgi:hypothetical protein
MAVKAIQTPEDAIEFVLENVLLSFEQSSLYDDYKDVDGWTEDDWRRMKQGLEQAKLAIAVVREFKEDCQRAADSNHARVVTKYLEEEWFDLSVTYKHAIEALRRIGKQEVS